MTERPIAVYGGSFDPPHIAHTMVAAYILGTIPVDRILVVPTFTHPLEKVGAVPFAQRFRMCELAFGAFPQCEVSDIERELGGKGRTLDTLEALAQLRPDASFRLVIGADILTELDRWHRWDRIAELAPPLVVGRAGYEGAPGVELPQVSSTEIRRRLTAGESTEGLLPWRVAEFIVEHRLYHEGDAPEEANR
ncbi:MAG: nicotinate (nicotinamide) nucleotide adenylyltransferase [Myxococcota bacterium]